MKNFVSHHGSPYRTQKLHQPCPDKRKQDNNNAKFSNQFIFASPSSIKLPPGSPRQPTSNHLSIASHAFTLLALSSLIGATLATPSMNTGRSQQNTGQRSNAPSTFASTNQPTNSSHIRPPTSPLLPIVTRTHPVTRRPRRVSKEHNGAVFREHATIMEVPIKNQKNLPFLKPQQQSHSHRQPRSPGIRQYIDQRTEPLTEQHQPIHHPARHSADVARARHARAIDLTQIKTPTLFLLELCFGWSRDLKNYRLEKEKREKEERDAFIRRFPFDPTTQSSYDYCVGYLRDAFIRSGLPESAMDQRINAEIMDTRHIHGASPNVPKQLQPIVYHTSWTPLEMATGSHLEEVKKYAGAMAALMGHYKVLWPPSFNAYIKNVLLQKQNDIWSSYTEFMVSSLDSGPLVDNAKKNIDAVTLGILIGYHKSFPDMAQDIDTLKQGVRSVSYKGSRVAGVFVAPGHVEGTMVIFSIPGDFPPTVIDATGSLLLQIPLYQNAIRKGLPLKMVASLEESLFKPYTKGRMHSRWITPYLTFSDPGNAGDILWTGYKENFKLNMDSTIFSKTEQYQLVALGVTKSTFKVATMLFGPALAPWTVSLIGGASAIPDALAATVVDDPKEVEVYLKHFLLGLVAESVGGLAFIGNKAIIKLEISRTASKLMMDPTKKDIEISKLLAWAKQKAPPIAPKASHTIGRISGNGIATGGVIRQLTKSKESNATLLNMTSNTPTNGAVTPLFPTTPAATIPPTKAPTTAPTWDALNAEERLTLTMADMLAGTDNFSYQDSAALMQGWFEIITQTLTTPNSKSPKELFLTLSPTAQKMSVIKYSLIHQGSNFNRTQALAFATKLQARPISPMMIDMVYFYAMEPLMLKRATETDYRTLEHPSEILREALALNTPERINTFLDSLEEGEQSRPTIGRKRTDPSPAMTREVIAFSTRQTAIFLTYYDETALPLPGYLYPEAMFHQYCQRQAAGEGWHFDHRSPIATILADYKRTLGVDQVTTPIALQVLHKLNYYDHDRMALSGFDDRYLGGLRNEAKLNEIPVYRFLNDQQKLNIFKTISATTGIPMDRPFNSVMFSAARVLTLFSDPADLTRANFTGGEHALLNKLVGLDLAASNNVGPIDPEWSVTFWKLIDGRADIPGVEQWLCKLRVNYFRRDRDLTIATINSLYQMAKAEPGRWVTPEMIELAIQFAQHTLIPFIDGDSPQTRMEAIDTYLTRVMGEQTPPESLQGWWDLLETEPTSLHVASNSSTIIRPNQPAIDTTNAMLTRAINTIGSEMFPGANIAPAPSHPETPRDPFAAAKLLVQSGHKGITATINGATYPIELIVNTHQATTVYEDEGTWFYGGFSAPKKNGLGTMSGIDKATRRFYSDWPEHTHTNDQTITLEVFNRNISDDPIIKMLPVTLALLKDSSNRNGSRIFDDTFEIDAATLLSTKDDPRLLFIKFYDGSSCFRLLVNAAEEFLGNWKYDYGNTLLPMTDSSQNVVFIPSDNDVMKLPKEFDLAGTEQDISPTRMHLKLWMDMLIKKEDEFGINSLMMNVILQQAGLEHLVYEPIDQQLSSDKKIGEFQYRIWLNKYLSARIKDIVPFELLQTTFTSNANEGITVTQLKRLRLLEQPLPSFSLSDAIRVEAGENSVRYQKYLYQIFNEHYLYQGLFAQLIATYTDRISSENPWRIRYISPSEAAEKLSTYAASHYLDHREKIAYLADTTKQSIFGLSPYGLVPLDQKTQAIIVMMEILTGHPYLTMEQMRTNRGAALELANECRRQIDKKAVPLVVSATIDGTIEAVNLHLLKDLTLTLRRNIDENKIGQKIILARLQNKEPGEPQLQE